jgi:protein-tyrosine phosphatase
VVALVLMILDVPIAAIEHDYGLTDAELIPERKERLIEIHEIGLTDEWADTAKDMIVSIERHLVEKYGGLDAYLDHIGFGADDRAEVREALLY